MNVRIFVAIGATCIALSLAGCAPLSEENTPVGTTPQEESEQETPATANSDPKNGLVVVSDGSYDYSAETRSPYIVKICDGSRLIYTDASGILTFFSDDPQCVG